MNTLTLEQNELLAKYFELQKQLQQVKTDELKQRNETLKTVFNYDPAELRNGTETIVLSELWKVSAVFKSVVNLVFSEDSELELAYNEVKNAVGEEIANSLINVSVGFDQERFDALPNEDKAIIADKCFKNHYSLNVENYQKLEGEAKVIFSSVVEEKPSQPTIAFKETKKKGRKK